MRPLHDFEYEHMEGRPVDFSNFLLYLAQKNKMRHVNLINLTLILILFGCTQPKTSKVFEQTKNYPEELKQLHQNVLSNILEEPADLQNVKKLLTEMQPDGTWSDIDYASKERGGWTPRNHLSNLLEISKAYQTLGTEFYQKKNSFRKNAFGAKFLARKRFDLSQLVVSRNWSSNGFGSGNDFNGTRTFA